MNVVGSLCFCSDCGSLLDLSSGTNTIKCDHCKASYSAKGTTCNDITVLIIHRQTFQALKSPLDHRQKPSLPHCEVNGPPSKRKKTKVRLPGQRYCLWKGTTDGPQVNEECPQCKNEEMMFYTLQMRSADEGTTVFFECERCGYISYPHAKEFQF